MRPWTKIDSNNKTKHKSGPQTKWNDLSPKQTMILAKVQQLRLAKTSGAEKGDGHSSSDPDKNPQESKIIFVETQTKLFKNCTGSPYHLVQKPRKRTNMLVDRRPPTRRSSKLASQAIKQESVSNKSLYADNDSSGSYCESFDSSSSESSFTVPNSPTPRLLCIPPEALPSAPLSEYEQQRQQVVAERLQFLASLDIGDSKDSLRELLPCSRTTNNVRGIKLSSKRKLSPRSPVTVRKSLRLQLRPADQPSPCYDSSFTSIGSIYSPGPPDKIRPEAGLSLVEYIPEWQGKSYWDKTLQQLQELSPAPKDGSGWTGSVTGVVQSLQHLCLSESGVTKVVPQRITSMAMHPCSDRDLVLCGDKIGTLGVWMPDTTSDTNGAWPFEVHVRGITRLTVDKGNNNRVLTSSYDGSTRSTDIHANKMMEMFSVDDGYGHPTWHALQDNNTLLVSTANGDLVQVDLRRPGKGTTVYTLDTRKSIKLVTVHPTDSNYFATANTKGTVCLWDSRNLRADKPLCSLTHHRTLTGLNFSPCTGSTLLATSHDDTIRLLSLEKLSTIKSKETIKHDNQTGRWLTTLKADFLPGREDLFIVGSMDKQRVVEVWSSTGSLCCRLSGDLLQTFSTTVCCHPSRPIVAAGNSSGRVHLFK